MSNVAAAHSHRQQHKAVISICRGLLCNVPWAAARHALIALHNSQVASKAGLSNLYSLPKYEQPLFVVATMVDPHYKLKFFSEALQNSATVLFVAEVRCIAVPANDGNGELPPTTKQPPIEAASKLFGVKHEIVSRGVHTGSA